MAWPRGNQLRKLGLKKLSASYKDSLHILMTGLIRPNSLGRYMYMYNILNPNMSDFLNDMGIKKKTYDIS